MRAFVYIYACVCVRVCVCACVLMCVRLSVHEFVPMGLERTTSVPLVRRSYHLISLETQTLCAWVRE